MKTNERMIEEMANVITSLLVGGSRYNGAAKAILKEYQKTREAAEKQLPCPECGDTAKGNVDRFCAACKEGLAGAVEYSNEILIGAAMAAVMVGFAVQM